MVGAMEPEVAPGALARWRLGLVAPEHRAARWTALALLVTLVAATYAFTVGRDPAGRPTARPYADAPYYYAYAPSLFLDRDLDLRDEYVVTGNWYRLGPTPLGRPGNVFGVGPALLTAPAFLVGHALALAAGHRRDGFSTEEQWLTMWMSVLASVAALWFPARIARRRLDAPTAGAVAALCVFAAGPVVYYAVRQPGYAHPFATLFAAWLVDAWDASYDRPRTARTWAGLGALLGLAILARPQLAPWALLPVVAAVGELRAAGWRPDRAMVGRWALGAAVAVMMVVPQLLTWKAIYGAYYVVPQGDGFMRWDAPAWSEVLFSARNGLLPWAPLYAVGLVGAALGALRWPRLFGPLVVATAAQAWINGAAWDWWGGGAFGGRRFDSVYVVVALGLAVALRPALAAVARPGRGPWPLVARRVAAAGAGFGALALVAALAVGNLVLAGHYTSPTARIGGGEAAADVIRRQVKGRLGRVMGWASELSNWPARRWFAARHDVEPGTYDQVVGVHLLGETFPGLNSIRPATSEHVVLSRLHPPLRRWLLGGGPDGALRVPFGRARILVGLNRRGAVRVTLTVWHPSVRGEVALAWNGRALARAALAATPATIELVTDDLRRGTNELAITAPPGALVSTLDLAATEGPR